MNTTELTANDVDETSETFGGYAVQYSVQTEAGSYAFGADIASARKFAERGQGRTVKMELWVHKTYCAYFGMVWSLPVGTEDFSSPVSVSASGAISW